MSVELLTNEDMDLSQEGFDEMMQESLGEEEHNRLTNLGRELLHPYGAGLMSTEDRPDGLTTLSSQHTTRPGGGDDNLG